MYRRPRTRDAGDHHGRRSAATCAPRERSLLLVRRTAFRRGHRGSGSPSLGYRSDLRPVRLVSSIDRAGECLLYGLTGDGFGFAIEQCFDGSSLVTRSSRSSLRVAAPAGLGRPASLFFRCIFSGPPLNGVRAPTLAPRLLQFLIFLPWPCSRVGRRFRRPCITEHAHADERPADFL
jgi:hypothetical protein